MDASLDDLLDQATRGEVDIADACASIGRLAQRNPAEADALIDAIQRRLRSGSVAPDIAQPLLSVLHGGTDTGTAVRFETPAPDSTRVRPQEFEATRLRTKSPSATSIHPATESRLAIESRPAAERRSDPVSNELAPGSIIKERFVIEELIG